LRSSAVLVALLATAPYALAQNPPAISSATATSAAPAATVALPNGRDTTLGHLIAVKGYVSAALPLLKNALNDNGGGFIEKATTDVNLTFADIDKAIAYVYAHPEVNVLENGPQPADEFQKMKEIMPQSMFPSYAQPSGRQ